jgi:hypothetical protein
MKHTCFLVSIGFGSEAPAIGNGNSSIEGGCWCVCDNSVSNSFTKHQIKSHSPGCDNLQVIDGCHNIISSTVDNKNLGIYKLTRKLLLHNFFLKLRLEEGHTNKDLA